MKEKPHSFHLPPAHGQIEHDVEEELAFHLAMREAKLRESGMPAHDARALARERFGDLESHKAECVREDHHQLRKARRMTWLEELRNDFVFTWRGIRRTKLLTVTALLTLALCIGATTTVMSIVNGVLLRPLPYPDPQQIARVYGVRKSWTTAPMSPPNLDDFRKSTRSFQYVGGSVWNEAAVTGIREPKRVVTASVTGDFFAVMGVKPILGRTLLADETVAHGPPVAVISHEFWQQSLGGESDLTRMHITLRGQVYSVVGVMPLDFLYPSNSKIWIGSIYPELNTVRSANLWSTIGRLRAGVTPVSAQNETNNFFKGLETQYGREAGVDGARVQLLNDVLVGSMRTPLLFLLGAVSFVLLIACANLASANFARAIARTQEMRVRVALGAARSRLVRQLLSEQLFVALGGGLLGIVLAIALIRLLVILGPQVSGIPRLEGVNVSAPMLLLAFALSVVTGLLIGAVPAWQLTRPSLPINAARSGRGATVDGGKTLRSLVMVEVALAITLMVGAGLLIRSLNTLLAGSPGFDASNVATVSISLPESKYQSHVATVNVFDKIFEATQAVPGVQHVGIINSLPYGPGIIGARYSTDDKPTDSERGAHYRLVSPGYFAAMRIPVMSGRVFSSADRDGATQVAVVTASLAKAAWPNENAVGRRLKLASGSDQHDEWLTVIGVVGNNKTYAADDARDGAVYVNYAQRPERALEGVTMVVRTEQNPTAATFTTAIRDRIRAIDPDIPPEFSSMELTVAASVANRRFTMLVTIGFGAVALLLAVLGVYSVLSYSVARRRQEIGVRLALGAAPERVMRLVLRDGMTAVVVGTLLGTAGAFAVARGMRSMLYQVSAGDPVSFVAGISVLLVAALIGCYFPARRAQQIDPVTAIRAD